MCLGTDEIEECYISANPLPFCRWRQTCPKEQRNGACSSLLGDRQCQALWGEKRVQYYKLKPVASNTHANLSSYTLMSMLSGNQLLCGDYTGEFFTFINLYCSLKPVWFCVQYSCMTVIMIQSILGKIIIIILMVFW